MQKIFACYWVTDFDQLVNEFRQAMSIPLFLFANTPEDAVRLFKEKYKEVYQKDESSDTGFALVWECGVYNLSETPGEIIKPAIRKLELD